MELHNAVINFTLIFASLIETTVHLSFLDIIPLCILGIVNSQLSQKEGKIRHVDEVSFNHCWQVMQLIPSNKPQQFSPRLANPLFADIHSLYLLTYLLTYSMGQSPS